MKIGLIDVDGHNYPNLPLMKLSAWHKKQGDMVRWYDPFDGLCEEYDKVYLSKVFSFTPDYGEPIYSKNIERGGGVDMPSIWSMGKRFTTSQKTRIYRMKSNTSTRITVCILI